MLAVKIRLEYCVKIFYKCNLKNYCVLYLRSFSLKSCFLIGISGNQLKSGIQVVKKQNKELGISTIFNVNKW